MPVSLDLQDSKRGPEDDNIPDSNDKPQENQSTDFKALKEEIRRVQSALDHKIKDKVDKRDIEEIQGNI